MENRKAGYPYYISIEMPSTNDLYLMMSDAISSLAKGARLPGMPTWSSGDEKLTIPILMLA